MVRTYPTLKPIKKATVMIDGVSGGFKVYILNSTWNGFAEPFFSKSEGMKLVKGLRTGPDAKYNVKLTYWPSKDAFVEKTDYGPLPYPAYTIETVDGPKKLYPIGAAVWTWMIKKRSW